MGAPKQKWTAEEEEALKAGVRKHGTGKWQLILKDPEFNHVLISRSNVDLKDKWRNINVTASGLGSREKARLALKKTPQTPTKNDDKSGTLNNLAQGEENAVESKPHLVPTSVDIGQPSVSVLKRPFTRLDSVIVEAITALKEPRGSDKSSIASYIKENYWEPPDFKKLVSTKLKFMTSSGKLVKANHRYRTAVRSPSSTHSREVDPLMNGKQKDGMNMEKEEVRIYKQPEVDAELNKMKRLPAHEAAAAAARAVVEAEAAIAEAEKAAREAEAAEAEAEAAQIFAQAAMRACRKLKV